MDAELVLRLLISMSRAHLMIVPVPRQQLVLVLRLPKSEPAILCTCNCVLSTGKIRVMPRVASWEDSAKHLKARACFNNDQ